MKDGPAGQKATTPPFAGLSHTDRRDWLCLLLGLGTFLVFLPVLWFEFTLYDDPGYVFENRHVATGVSLGNLSWALSALHGDMSYWHPLTWFSHQLDCQLFGLRAGAHHLTSALLHSVAGVLLFLFLHRTTGRFGCSAMVAALFCLHPLHVESVAWIAERKDVLTAVFWFATLLAYAGYVRHRTVRRYLLVLLCFILDLMAKPSAVTLPFVLLLMDYWPLGRFGQANAVKLVAADVSPLHLDTEESQSGLTSAATGLRGGRWDRSGASAERRHSRVRQFAALCRDAATVRLVIEKIPFFALSALASWAAFEAQRQLGAVSPLEGLDRSYRADNTLIAYATYILKTFWPTDLAVIYQRSGPWPFGLVLVAGAFLTAVSYAAWRLRRSQPYLLVGWLWFLGVLVPMIGIVQVGAQWMADRYTYISLVGVFIMIVWGGAEVARRFAVPKGVTVALGLAALAVLLPVTRLQLQHWKDSRALFAHAAAVTRGNWLAHHNLALALSGEGKHQEADVQLAEALRISPRNPTANKTRAHVALNLGDLKRAAALYREVLAAKPDELEAHGQLAWLYATSEDADLRSGFLAVKHAQTVRNESKAADAGQFDILAAAYAENGQFKEAVSAPRLAAAAHAPRGRPAAQVCLRGSHL